jgi:hypothetical protein
MKLTDLKDHIATVLPDERNAMSLTWEELLSALFVSSLSWYSLLGHCCSSGRMARPW